MTDTPARCLRRLTSVSATIAAVLLATNGLGAVAPPENPFTPPGYRLVWSDNFETLSLRTGGPSYYGLLHGNGTWASPGATYSDDPRGVAGYGGYDWFVDPSYPHWPAGYPAFGQFAIMPDGMRIRAEPASPAMAKSLPLNLKHPGVTPWVSGQLNSYDAVQIKPPFYFEVRAKMPEGVGRPFPAIWLMTNAKKPYRNGSPGIRSPGKEYEVDVQEGFGDSNRLHATIHWNPSPIAPEYLRRPVVDRPSGVDLAAGFNTWGCLVTDKQQTFFFNGKKVGEVRSPASADVDQPFEIILDVAAGMPWVGPPSGGPFDMTVRYVRLYAPPSNHFRVDAAFHANVLGRRSGGAVSLSRAATK